MTWQEYDWLCEANTLKEELKWTHTRELLAMYRNAHLGKTGRAMSGKELIPLSFDMDEETKPLTIEQHNELLKQFGLDGKRNS